MLKFKFLGANGSLQDLESGNTSLLLSGEEGSAAVDVSCNLTAVVDADVDAVILTHEHIDHIYALPSLLHQLWICGREKPLNIYLPESMELQINQLIDLFRIREKKNIFTIAIHKETDFSIGSMQITAFPTDHTDCSRGLAVQDGKDKLVYTCDTRPITEILPCMRGAQVLIHETSGLFKDEETLIKKGHSSGLDAGKLACRLEAEALYLCHLPRGEQAKAEILAESRTVFPKAYIPQMLTEIAVSGQNL